MVQAEINNKTEQNLTMVPDLQAQQMANEAQAQQQAEQSDQQFQRQLEQETTRNDELAAQQVKHQMIGDALGVNQEQPPQNA
jgi:Cu2+-containing amine oxidase